MIHLMISHLIFLTREERYALIDRETIEVIGVNVPTWIANRDDSNAAQEIFCRYVLTNHDKDNIRVLVSSEGYHVNLPQQLDEERPELTNEQWRLMTPEQRDRWYAKHRPIPTAENLRDISDNGSVYLKFRYISLTAELKTIHNFEIKTREDLVNSLI